MRLLLYILAFFLCSSLYAQQQINISGKWVGKITQQEGGYASDYDMELVLYQEGENIKGKSYFYIDDIYAILEITGGFKSNILFYFKEIKILDAATKESLEWCIKKGQLLLKKDGDTLKLEGFWQGNSEAGPCIPGKIFLKKEVERA